MKKKSTRKRIRKVALSSAYGKLGKLTDQEKAARYDSFYGVVRALGPALDELAELYDSGKLAELGKLLGMVAERWNVP